jgi:hypothetical protein
MEKADWERWDRFDWNRRLIDYYFASSASNSDPIHRLDVSWAVLASLTGDSAVHPDYVRDRFLDRVRRSLGEETIGNFLSSRAIMYRGVPTSFVYLFVTCLAASEVQEDREEEGEVEKNFRDALCTMLGSSRHAAGLEKVAEAWERFADWTRSEEVVGRFRQLILPDSGNENLIGYSKRLVFPRLRDQMRLAQLLERAGMLMEDPPIAMLLQQLRPMRKEMLGELQVAFEELIALVDDSPDENTDSRFLNAVNSVARNAALLGGNTSATGSLTILLLDYADTIELVAASTDPEPFDGAVTILDDFLPVEWPYRVSQVADGSDGATSLFEAGTRSSLSWVVRPGIVPFTAGDSGVPEVLKRGRLDDAGYALVRSDRLEQFRAAFGVSEGRVRPSPLDEWFVVRDPALGQLSADQLVAAGLSDVPVLHPRPVRNSLRLRDGYPVLGDFLGFRSTAPWISAPGATTVTAALDGEPLTLEGGAGRWRLPDRGLFGSLRVRAEFSEGNALERLVSLISEPPGLDFKPPSNENDWMQETLAGTSIYQAAKAANTAEVEQEIPDGTHRIYLGPVVGEFLPSAAGAAYELSSFGEIKWVRLLNAEAPEAPTSRVADKGLCRRWRKAIEEFLPHAESEEAAQSLRRAKTSTTDLKTLDIVVSERGHRPNAERAPMPNEGCLLVQASVGAVCARRAGMPIRDWNRLLETAFSLNFEQRRLVHRAWLESGLVDELRRTRWPSAAIFARKPVLLTFRVGSARFGSVDGLVMPSRLVQLREVASSLGLSTSLNRSPSPYLPARLMVRSDDPSTIDEFAAAAELQVRYLSSEPASPVRRRDVESREIRAGFATRRAFPTFPPPDGVALTMHYRADAPPYWSALIDDRTIWSYSPEAVSFWIRRALGKDVARLVSGAELEPVATFLPLSLARWLAVVSGTNPGPRQQNTYVNLAPSRHLAERVLGVLASLSSQQTSIGVEDD